jgi:hypothetical protein
MKTPWRWPQRSARLFRHLPPLAAGDVLGDLYQEYQTRLARTGRLRTEWWLSRQIWSLTRAYARYEPTRRSFLSALRAGELAQTLRSLARSPWYAATALAVVALSTALGTAIFAIVDGTLFKPLPYQAPSRLFAVSLGFSRLSEPLASMPGLTSRGCRLAGSAAGSDVHGVRHERPADRWTPEQCAPC